MQCDPSLFGRLVSSADFEFTALSYNNVFIPPLWNGILCSVTSHSLPERAGLMFWYETEISTVLFFYFISNIAIV